MFKAPLLSLAILLAFTATPPAHAYNAADGSNAKRVAHHHHARQGAASHQAGEDVCRRDAVRLCKPVLAQGNMTVLGC